MANPYMLGPADDAILQALLRYHFLTSRQVTRLLYSAGSLTYVQSRLKRLVEAEYCLKTFLPRPAQSGKAPSVFALSRKGRRVLQEQGLEVPRRFRPGDLKEHTYLHLAHTLAVNDFLIAVAIFCRQQPRVELAAMLHERTLKLQPLSIPDAAGRQQAVVFDAWLDLRITEPGGQSYQSCIALELDRSTLEQKRWRQKITNIIAARQGPYAKAFGTTSLTVAVLATGGTRRLEQLVSWTEAELTACSESAAGDYFLFAAFDPAEIEPAAMLTSPTWRMPFQRELVSLLDAP